MGCSGSAARPAEPCFDKADKGRRAIVRAGGVECTGGAGSHNPEWWACACGNIIERDSGEHRFAFERQKGANLGADARMYACVGLLSSSASRDRLPNSCLALDSSGYFYIDNKIQHDKSVRNFDGYIEGFGVGAVVSLVVQTDGPMPVAAWLVDGAEVTRSEVAAGYGCRIAVGGFRDTDAWRIVDWAERWAALKGVQVKVEKS